MTMKADDRLTFRLPTVRKADFLKKVEKEGKKTSEVLNELVERYLEQQLEQTSDIEEIKSRLNKLEEKLMGESAA
jgi:hypothetical protein